MLAYFVLSSLLHLLWPSFIHYLYLKHHGYSQSSSTCRGNDDYYQRWGCNAVSYPACEPAFFQTSNFALKRCANYRLQGNTTSNFPWVIPRGRRTAQRRRRSVPLGIKCSICGYTSSVLCQRTQYRQRCG
ncbi:hypothetical protein OG21DRAFT_521856 [Imleria badia]|nr:hypothetical protein OG21DRAFT_521856 [Imleria badia]